jgi:hypothetical protein
MHSLMDVLRELDDPRRISSRHYPLSLMLWLVSMGLLCGAQHLSDIVRSVQWLGQRERRALGLPRKKNMCVYRVPCANAFRDLLPMLDLEPFITLLNTSLAQHEGILPRTPALDGKDLGGQMDTIISPINTTRQASAVTPEDEQDHAHTPPIAMACAPGKGHAIIAARTLLQRPEINLCGAVLTADALHAHKETLHTIVTKGGDDLVRLRDNQPQAAAFAQTQVAETPPLFKNHQGPRSTDPPRGPRRRRPSRIHRPALRPLGHQCHVDPGCLQNPSERLHRHTSLRLQSRPQYSSQATGRHRPQSPGRRE